MISHRASEISYARDHIWSPPLSLVMYVVAVALSIIVIIPSSAVAGEQNNFQLICANGAVAQVRGDGSIELVDESKLEREKERAKSVLTKSRTSSSYKDVQISQWQLKHLERKLRATNKQKGTCRKLSK